MPQFQLLPSNDSFESKLGQQLGQGVGQGLQGALANFQKDRKIKQSENLFRQQGYPEDLAKLAAAATTGGQTEVLKNVLELRQRGGLGSMLGSQQPREEVEEISEAEIGLTPKEKVTHQREQEKRSFERNKKFLDRISSIAEEIPKERVALSQMQGALEKGDFNSWRNTIAELIGQDVLKTASAQTVNSASKQFLMSSLAGLTGRPNQFIEKQITKALISPVYKKEANALIFEGLQGLSRLKEREVEIAEQLEEKYTKKGREIPRNFQKLVREELKKEARDFEEDYQNRLETLLDKEKSSVLMNAPDGKVYSVPKSEAKAAKASGYTLVK